VVPIGSKIMMFGAVSKKPSGLFVGRKGKPSPSAGKKCYADAVKSHRHLRSSKLSVFQRLSFPSNYVLNYFSANGRPSSEKDSRRPSPEKKGPRRVWVPKESASIPASPGAKSPAVTDPLNDAPLDNPMADATAVSPPPLVGNSNSNPFPSGPGPKPLCSSCSGPGQYRKACSSLVLFLGCINHAYDISGCLAKGWNPGIFRPKPSSEVEGMPPRTPS
jgi:hypothetical protein